VETAAYAEKIAFQDSLDALLSTRRLNRRVLEAFDASAAHIVALAEKAVLPWRQRPEGAMTPPTLP
jgi:hypothetical protein